MKVKVFEVFDNYSEKVNQTFKPSKLVLLDRLFYFRKLQPVAFKDTRFLLYRDAHLWALFPVELSQGLSSILSFCLPNIAEIKTRDELKEYFKLLCEIDRILDSWESSQRDDVLLLKELDTPPGADFLDPVLSLAIYEFMIKPAVQLHHKESGSFFLSGGIEYLGGFWFRIGSILAALTIRSLLERTQLTWSIMGSENSMSKSLHKLLRVFSFTVARSGELVLPEFVQPKDLLKLKLIPFRVLDLEVDPWGFFELFSKGRLKKYSFELLRDSRPRSFGGYSFLQWVLKDFKSKNRFSKPGIDFDFVVESNEI